MSEQFEAHLDVEQAGSTALDFLDQKIDFSKQALKKIMQNGAVWVESARGVNRLRRAKKILKPGEIVHLYYDRQVQAQHPPEAELIEDVQEYSVWNKPAGMWSQGSKWGDHCTLYRWAETHLSPQRPAFIVHRLDKAASGLMLLAHSKHIARQLALLFEQRAVSKHYLAWVDGEFSGKHDGENLPLEINVPLDGKVAITEIMQARFDSDKNRSELLINIKTGRKHQIRRHLQHIGFPIIGDRRYGDAHSSEDLQLVSTYLAFTCPLTGEEKRFIIHR